MATQPDEPVDHYWDEEASKSVRGIFTNRIFCQHLGSGLIRLSFAEVLSEADPQYHSALVVTAENAFAFGQLMQRMALAALGQSEPPPVVNVAEAENGGA